MRLSEDWIVLPLIVKSIEFSKANDGAILEASTDTALKAKLIGMDRGSIDPDEVSPGDS